MSLDPSQFLRSIGGGGYIKVSDSYNSIHTRVVSVNCMENQFLLFRPVFDQDFGIGSGVALYVELRRLRLSESDLPATDFD